MQRKPLIAGIDPGTTAAYALLDTEGKLVAVRSSKELDLNAVLREATAYGTIIAAGTDKKKCPAFVEKFAIRTGARLIAPDEDLLSREKAALVKIKTGNEHERDALAAALYAYRKLQPLLTKVLLFAEKESIAGKEKLTEAVVKEAISIRKAAENMQETAVPVAVQTKAGKQQKTSSSDEKLREEKMILQQQMRRIRSIARKLKRQNRKLQQKLDSYQPDAEAMKMLSNKDSTIQALRRHLQKSSNENRKLQREIATLEWFIAADAGIIIGRKLRGFGKEDVEKGWRFRSGDVVVVEDANRYSEKTIAVMKEKISVVATKTPATRKTKEELPCTIVDAEKVVVEESGNFAAVDRKKLQHEIAKQDILSRVVAAYRSER